MTVESLESIYINITFFTVVISSIFYLISLVKKQNKLFMKIAYISMIAGFISITMVLIFRTILSGHDPLSNFFESMIFMIWGSFLIFLFIMSKYKSVFIGITMTPFICIMMGMASILPQEWKEIRPLMPALQSYWLKIHVSTVMISYSSFVLSVVTAIVFLIFLKKEKSDENEKFLKMYDELTYRLILFGFPLLGFGIISGAIWANYAWGSYWSWDPKEVSALMTWLFYAAYLHARHTNTWSGKTSAIIAIIGFLALIFTYYGVNYLPGLHSYGF